MNPDNLRIRPHGADELSHYSVETVDVEYRFSWGWDELEGIANRTDFDLKQHTEHSGEDLSYFDPATGTRVVPYVIEPAAGATRTTFAFLIDGYRTEQVRGSERVVLGLDPRLAPYKAAVLPLSRKPELVEPASRIADDLSRRMSVEFDITQSIGRRYRRQDEIGTPLCVTYDFDSLDDQSVTVRHRDTMHQDRVSAPTGCTPTWWSTWDCEPQSPGRRAGGGGRRRAGGGDLVLRGGERGRSHPGDRSPHHLRSRPPRPRRPRQLPPPRRLPRRRGRTVTARPRFLPPNPPPSPPGPMTPMRPLKATGRRRKPRRRHRKRSRSNRRM